MTGPKRRQSVGPPRRLAAPRRAGPAALLPPALLLCALAGGIAALCLAESMTAQASEPSQASGMRGRVIRVLTWNVLAPTAFERLAGVLFGTASKERSRALLREARGIDPDVVGLQEVSAELLAVLGEDPDWSGYHASASGPGEPPGGLLVLSRYPFAKVAYRKLPSPSGRYALLATLDLGEETLVVANVHLESPLESAGARAEQIEFVNARLPRGGATAWLGDFNFGDGDPEAKRLAGWTDVWTRLRAGEKGHTYDLDANPLARDNAFASEPSRRIDRILVTSRLAPTAVGLAGTKAPSSDHFGLWADLQQTEPRQGVLGPLP